jgi:iron complex transport system ATP-binding protein
MPDLSLANVSYFVNSSPIVQNISLSVVSGDWLCIAGCNGSGKSTVLRLMAGLLMPTQGLIQWGGQSFVDLPDKNQQISILSQHSNISADLTVQELVQLGRYPYLPNWEVRLSVADREQVDYAIEFVGLDHFRDRSLFTLSGGERQRAFLALALAQNGSILLLDEPTNHLDIVAQNQILSLLKKMVDKGKMVVSVFHDLNHIARYSSHLALMRDGKLLESGPTELVFRSQALTEAFGLPIRVIEIEGQRCALY